MHSILEVCWRSVVAWGVCAALVAGCTDSEAGSPWALHGPGGDARERADGTARGDVRSDVRDARPTDLADVAPEEVEPDPDTLDTRPFDESELDGTDTDCEREISVRIRGFDMPFSAMRGPIVVDRNTSAGPPIADIYAERKPKGEGDDPEIVHIDPETGKQTVLTSNDEFDRLLYAAQIKGTSRALIRRSKSRGADEATPVVLSPGGLETTYDSFPDEWETATERRNGRGVRPFDGSRFAFRLPNDPNRQPGWVGYVDGEAPAKRHHVQEWIEPGIALTRNGFALSGRTGPLSGGGNYEVFVFREGEGLERVTRTEADERFVVATDRTLYWRTTEGVTRYDLETDRTETIEQGNCNRLYAKDGRAVFTCAEAVSGGEPAMGREIFVHANGRTRSIATRNGLVFSPRLGPESVVWAEYESRSTLCRGSRTGELMYADLRSGAIQKIADIGGPCLCCSALFPNMHVSYDGDVIAWNYANPGSSNPGRGATNRGGYALVERRCR